VDLEFHALSNLARVIKLARARVRRLLVDLVLRALDDVLDRELRQLLRQSGASSAGDAEVGLYPIVTFQYSSTILYPGFLSYSVPVFLN
jgi:hypothetical protein